MQSVATARPSSIPTSVLAQEILKYGTLERRGKFSYLTYNDYEMDLDGLYISRGGRFYVRVSLVGLEGHEINRMRYERLAEGGAA